ncbi:MAG: precorrin-3B C(17)-methyltransferase [Spongiibacteraceae bacterium]
MSSTNNPNRTKSIPNKNIAIVMLGNGSAQTARKMKTLYPAALIYGLQARVEFADRFYQDFGATLRDLYQSNTALIALCSAGIVIRTLAPVLALKGAEPSVLAVAEDGSAVVPLLGGLSGVNVMARDIAAALQVSAAITTSGELRFGTCLLNPPPGYVLADIEQGKRFVSDLLGGNTIRIEGNADWLGDANLVLDSTAQHIIRVTANTSAETVNELLIHPRSVIAAVDEKNSGHEDLIAAVHNELEAASISPLSLACIAAPISAISNLQLQYVADEFNVPLRFVADLQSLPSVVTKKTVAKKMVAEQIVARQNALGRVRLHVADTPIDPLAIGQARGSLTVVGLGPGAAEFMVPAAKIALQQAEDILGYETYVKMVGPFRDDQLVHCTDNREEMQRARHAFELAAQGRRVVVVSSGDPGVFAMAAAVLEALHESDNSDWHAVDLQIFPGVSAALATAARAGAPLGHDFCVMSLSDNLKPWEIIEKRLDHAAAADFVLAFYNPISKARPWQLTRTLEIVARHRRADTVVVLGRDIGRPAEALTTMTLADLRSEQVDMRTLVIIGSSTTTRFMRGDKKNAQWVYTPRWYGKKS